MFERELRPVSTAAPQLRQIDPERHAFMHDAEAESRRLCTYTIQTNCELYVANAAGCCGDAQQRAYLLANEHNTPMTLIARNASGGKDQFFTAYPDSWFDNPVQAG
jgi:hypothetical protein